MHCTSLQADLVLSADQKQRLLDARQQVLPEIERIIAERERLTGCLQASVHVLMPHTCITFPAQA